MLKVVIIITCLLILSYKLSVVDLTDRIRPFGTDNVKNEKFAKDLVGEDFGKNTYWGRPDSNDDIGKMIDKIQWLSHSYENDVIWRRGIAIAIIISIILLGSMNPQYFLDSKTLVMFISVLFICVYFTLTFYKHHFLWRRTKFIDTHVRKIKNKLKLKQYNHIDKNKLI